MDHCILEREILTAHFSGCSQSWTAIQRPGVISHMICIEFTFLDTLRSPMAKRLAVLKVRTWPFVDCCRVQLFLHKRDGVTAGCLY